MSLLCRIFGHRWVYHMTNFGPTKYRTCRCRRLDQYISLRGTNGKPEYSWVMMNRYTKLGAKEMLTKLPAPRRWRCKNCGMETNRFANVHLFANGVECGVFEPVVPEAGPREAKGDED